MHVQSSQSPFGRCAVCARAVRCFTCTEAATTGRPLTFLEHILLRRAHTDIDDHKAREEQRKSEYTARAFHR